MWGIEAPPTRAEQVEVVARALHATRHDRDLGVTWESAKGITREHWRARARTVIDALAEAGMLR